MNFYEYIYCISFIILYRCSLIRAYNRDLKIKSNLESVTPSSMGLQFSVEVNNTSNNDYYVELNSEQCCLQSDRDIECDIVAIIGGCIDTIPKGTTKTLNLVAPLLNPYDRKGYCMAYLDSHKIKKPRRILRDKVKMSFDTSPKCRKSNMDVIHSIRTCTKIDQDPLNDCNPVDCEVHYNGKKSHYSKNLEKCVNIPPCIPDIEDKTNSDLPNIVYDPASNLCTSGNSITKNDISYIKSLAKGKRRNIKELLLIKNSEPLEIMRIPTNISMDPNEEITKKFEELAFLNAKDDTVEKKNKGLLSSMVNYFNYNRYIFFVLGIVILVQCCLICSMIICLTRNCYCVKDKKVVRKFFNYRQDVSVTTPLIGTSNADTETTNYQYLSESSNNINKRIRCYKACQKARCNNLKMSLSDDILSKCLNRRDWKRKYPKSDSMLENNALNIEENVLRNVTHFDNNTYKNEEIKITIEKDNKESSGLIEPTINFENEIPCQNISKECKKFKYSEPKLVETNSNFHSKLTGNDSDDIQTSSEKEIRCTSYNGMEENSRVVNTMKNPKFIKSDIFTRRTFSLSTEKGAQACFSNDSIDDYLSERGMLYLNGENISKYSFSSQSDQAKSCSISEISSKTSKNNIVRNVLEIIRQRSKQSPSSDPGTKTSVHIIHMSRPSVYSSSNNNSECLKSLNGDHSRTSL